MLKDRYGLSVGPLREAMSRLSAERLIDQEGQRGFRVAPLRAKEAAEIGEMRLLVEAEALRKSIPAGDTAWEEGVITTFFRLEQVETAPGRDAETLARWEGLNAVDGGNPLHATYFRVKLSPTSGFQRHGGDDFAELTLSGTVLSDDTRTGAGLSKFVEMAMI